MAKIFINDFVSNHCTGKNNDRNYVRVTLNGYNEETKQDIKIKFSTANKLSILKALEDLEQKSIDIELEEIRGKWDGKMFSYYQEVKGGTVLADLGLIIKRPKDAGFVNPDID